MSSSVLAGRTAIVSGAGRGIGAAIAKRLAAGGAAVALLDIDAAACDKTVAEIAAENGVATAHPTDITDPLSVEDSVQAVASGLGRPSILVNNAGIIRDNLLHRMTIDDWQSVMQVHLQGAFLLTRAVRQHMAEEGWGRVVNLSSTSALGKRGQANYASAKAGLQGFTKALAIEMGPFGVTVNAVAPGFIDTDMTRATASRLGMDFDEFKTKAAEAIPVGRVGTPEDVAAAVAFFASPEAGFITGQVLYVAGGPKT